MISLQKAVNIRKGNNKTTMTQDLYPCPSMEKLKDDFLGKTLHHVQTPAAVIDRQVVKRNCEQMHRAIRELNLAFRAHVKTHKVREAERQSGRVAVWHRLPCRLPLHLS